MHIICRLLLYVKKLIPSSAHFCVLLQNVDVFHYCVFALSANLVNMGPGIFCSNQNFPFRLITLCLYIPMSCMNTFSKSMAVSWGFFRELFFYTPLTLKLFPSIVIAILESRDFAYLHRILTELLSLLILLSIILYQVLFVCSSTNFFWHLFHILISLFSLSQPCVVLRCLIVTYTWLKYFQCLRCHS